MSKTIEQMAEDARKKRGYTHMVAGIYKIGFSDGVKAQAEVDAGKLEKLKSKLTYLVEMNSENESAFGFVLDALKDLFPGSKS